MMRVTFLRERVIASLAASIALAAMLATSSSARAGLLAYEGFGYTGTAGAPYAELNAKGGSETGFTGTWGPFFGSVLDLGGPLTHGALVTSGNSTAWGDPSKSTQTGKRSLTTGLVDKSDGSDLWIGMLFKGGSGGTFQLAALDGPPSLAWGWNSNNGSTGRNYELSAANTWSLPATGKIANVDGRTDFIALHVEFNDAAAENISMYVVKGGDTIGATPGTPYHTTTAELGAKDLDDINLWTNSSAGAYDEIRLGTTFADVAPIPEPSTLALACFALVGMVGGTRRRRR